MEELGKETDLKPSLVAFNSNRRTLKLSFIRLQSKSNCASLMISALLQDQSCITIKYYLWYWWKNPTTNCHWLMRGVNRRSNIKRICWLKLLLVQLNWFQKNWPKEICPWKTYQFLYSHKHHTVKWTLHHCRDHRACESIWRDGCETSIDIYFWYLKLKFGYFSIFRILEIVPNYRIF